jgi:trehalose 6-phosphate synthase
MRRLYLFWVYAVTLTALIAGSLLATFEEQRMLNDATSRLAMLSSSIEESIVLNYNEKRFSGIAKLVERLSSNKKLMSLAICDLGQNVSVGFPTHEQSWKQLCESPTAKAAFLTPTDFSWTASTPSLKLQYFSHPLEKIGTEYSNQFLVISQNVSYLRTAWFESFLRNFASIWLAGLALLFLVATQIRSWIGAHFKLLQQALRAMVAGKKPQPLPEAIGKPISNEIDKLAAKILELKPKPKNEESSWIKSLKESMGTRKLVVIANREPYIHQRKNDQIEVVRPASGLVTALEPVLRQFGGLWIAHGSGTADLETANEAGEVQVPPKNPKYTLRRVFLSREEELGYYYGFSNEGLWPLCHLAHNRPSFRLQDWEQYKTVNQRFVDSIPPDSFQGDSLILVQDYHFALLPRMARDKSLFGKNKIGLFWHIPWPNPEAFGICPWSKELLKGMLGSDVIGFHTQYHCNNFLETCNRYLEARIDWEHFSVTMDNHETFVKAFPIGIDTSPVRTLASHEVNEIKKKYGIRTEIVAVGVDRLDYTKGIVERVEAVERLLEKHPEYIGKFCLVQMGSPSRTHIPAYRFFADQMEQVVQRVNQRFGSIDGDNPYRPIVFLHEHHEWEEIQYFYQMGDICMVTSLHDGMNLVAKEYVWCQRADRGALILSKFTGASRELTEAFIVNPYSIEELADAIASAIELPLEERTRRMEAMKEKIHSHNAFHWASDLIRALLTKEEISQPQPLLTDLQDTYQLVKEF